MDYSNNCVKRGLEESNLRLVFLDYVHEHLRSYASVADMSVSEASQSLADFSLVVWHSLKMGGATQDRGVAF